MDTHQQDPLAAHAPQGSESHAVSMPPLAERQRAMRRTRLVAVVALVLLALGAGRTVISRVENSRTLDNGTIERAKQYVRVTLPQTGGASQTLQLPGSLQGQVQSPIAARSSGYLKRWYKDIGSRVEKGDLLAEIETPEIDQQLTQAVAARQQTAASLDLARTTVERWESLRKRDAVSQQELEERRSAFAQAGANLAAADANVERLRQMEGFKRIVAPFSGIITRRNVDIGDLIDAGGANGRALFMLTQTDPLRVYVNVPQAYAQLVKAGQQVTVNQAELRGQSFKGEVVRTAGAIDAASRSMQVEIALPNKDGRLLPGAFVQVSLPIKADKSLTVPANTLLFRGEGTRVATVDAGGKVKLKPVVLGRNLGNSVEVIDGLGDADRLVLNPADSLADGDAVEVAKNEDKPAGAADATKKAAP